MINLEIRALRQKIAERDEEAERLKEEVAAATFDPKVRPAADPRQASWILRVAWVLCLAFITNVVIMENQACRLAYSSPFTCTSHRYSRCKSINLFQAMAGLKLMRKCKKLLEENNELGKLVLLQIGSSSTRIWRKAVL